MKNFTKSLITILLIYSSCYCQSLPPNSVTIKKGWQKIYIRNVADFDMPPTMEIQEGKYKKMVDIFRKDVGLDISNTPIVLQQKGLNDYGEKGFEKYARVMFQTTFGNQGDFLELNFNISDVSQLEISEINNRYKKESQKYFQNEFLKLIKWHPLKLEKINGMSCIHTIYERQLKNKPIVLVHTYYFQNYDRMHTLTLSYRINESKYWESDFYRVLKSLRITKIKE